MYAAIIMRGLGGLLLVAAALKIQGRAIEPVGSAALLSEPWLQFLVIEWEIGLAIWLIWGLNPRLAWLAATLTFATFAAVSAWLGVTAHASCNCFGAIRVSPWIAFFIDVAALSLLISAIRKIRTAQKWPQLSSVITTIVFGICTVSAVLGLLAAASTVAFGSPEAGLAYLRGDRISVRPTLVEVGRGRLDETVDAYVFLHNWTNRPIRIIGGSADCSCLTTKDLPTVVEPGEHRRVTLTIDFVGPPGRFLRTGAFLTDDPEAQRIRFRVAGTSDE